MTDLDGLGKLDERAMQAAAGAGLALSRDAGGLALSDGTLAVRGDFTRMLARLRPANLQREMLVKAVRVKGADPSEVRVADATAGLGEDSLLLAAAGFPVVMLERNPVAAALLADALERAAAHPQLACAASRMSLVNADSADTLPLLRPAPDVVLLDPMFPAKHGDARAKKKLQMLQALEPPADAADEHALLEAAFAAHPRKVVVKRPLKGPHLAGRKPSHTLAGKTVRYDVYHLPGAGGKPGAGGRAGGAGA